MYFFSQWRIEMNSTQQHPAKCHGKYIEIHHQAIQLTHQSGGKNLKNYFWLTTFANYKCNNKRIAFKVGLEIRKESTNIHLAAIQGNLDDFCWQQNSIMKFLRIQTKKKWSRFFKIWWKSFVKFPSHGAVIVIDVIFPKIDSLVENITTKVFNCHREKIRQ